MTTPARWWTRAIVLGVLSGAVLFLAGKLSFLCDDAYITFRHVSNAMDGHGLTWNVPPFQPVEGYTSFSWAVLLWAVWSWFGVEPPAAANALSMAIGLGIFALAAWAAFRLRRADGSRLPDAVTLFALATLAGNRCFLQWFTGGLETALFNFAFAAWVLLAFRSDDRRGAGWLAWWSAAAALTALTRPDGLLLVAATVATALWLAARRSLSWRDLVVGCLPLCVVLAHVLWRHSFYGEWLPNTYYAKVTASWPAAGWRYLACFAFEQGLWPWSVMVVAGLVFACARRCLRFAPLFGRHLPALAAVAATLAHVGYYVVVVGGDHFEYRVFSYLIPLFALALLAILTKVGARAVVVVAAFGLYALAASVGWVHYVLVRPAVAPDFALLSDELPAWARPLAREYDRNQLWLQMQFVCVRCRAHKKSMDDILSTYPPREHRGIDLTSVPDVPVLQAKVVGYVSWSLADCASIDLLGLCDWVAARTPTTAASGFLPPAVLQLVLADADADHDGWQTQDELATRFVDVLQPTVPSLTREGATGFVRILLLLFARERDDSLTVAESAEIVPFFAQLRFMAHERMAPAEYVQALDPNVTVENRRTVVRPRQTPLTAARVRAIEAEWRQRVRQGR